MRTGRTAIRLPGGTRLARVLRQGRVGRARTPYPPAYAEEEVRAPLAREGIGPDDLAEILTTLASPRLDARERRLVPFARETVRYQAAAIQSRLRETCRNFALERSWENSARQFVGNLTSLQPSRILRASPVMARRPVRG